MISTEVWVIQGKNKLIRVAKSPGLIFEEVRLVGWVSNCGKILEGAMLHCTTYNLVKCLMGNRKVEELK